MTKKIITLFSLILLFSVFFLPVFGQTSTSTIEELIQRLKQQISDLNSQIEALNKQFQEVKQTLKLLRQLRLGMTGDDVKLLQETLATDPEIYPEGLVTGYFGRLTEKAVKRFQQKMGVEQVGSVGPKTLSKINELLTEGAGASGKVPPGLLIAPGIRAKLGYQPQPLPGQELPPGIAKKLATTTPTTTPDTAAPVISGLMATSTTASSTRIVWTTNELSNSKVWYGTSTPLSITTSTPMVSSASLVTSHDLTISGLNATTTYYYLVSSADAAGNTATSSESSFTTLPE